MEEEIGRYLTGREVVHHIDGDKSNNVLSNLNLFDSNSTHMSYAHRLADTDKDVALLREYALDPFLRKGDLPWGYSKTRRMIKDYAVSWVSANETHLLEEDVVQALKAPSLKEAARSLGVNPDTLWKYYPALCRNHPNRTRTGTGVRLEKSFRQ